jgi:hypothetical protein
MFAWYRDAARCYVYLSDVSTDEDALKIPKESLAQSRWFSRGWTLRELVAPANVEFFSREGTHLGNKRSLVQELNNITKISIEALQGRVTLSELSVEERMSWRRNCQTKRPEDSSYCMLGIFDLNMLPIYGEGEKKAFVRLERKIRKISNGGSTVVHNSDEATCSYRGPVFYGSITGRHVISGTHVTGGVVNFDLR